MKNTERFQKLQKAFLAEGLCPGDALKKAYAILWEEARLDCCQMAAKHSLQKVVTVEHYGTHEQWKSYWTDVANILGVAPEVLFRFEWNIRQVLGLPSLYTAPKPRSGRKPKREQQAVSEVV